MLYDVFAMCNALYDLQALVDYDVLQTLGLTPGGMHLVDDATRAALIHQVEHAVVNRAAGGSGANTATGIAVLGGRACYVSRVGADTQAVEYAELLAKSGVEPLLARGNGVTGSCLVLITPDGQRTMCTFLGEGRNLGPEDIPVDFVRQSRMLYFTGYLWDTPRQREAVLQAISAARQTGTPIAFSLADRFCVEQNRDDFLRLLDSGVNVVFGNEEEACLLAAERDATEAAAYLASRAGQSFVTLGGKGALVAGNGKVEHVQAHSVEVVDTTGAGDAFAAAVLYGITHGYEPAAAADLGCWLAGHVVSRLGARPDRDTLAWPDTEPQVTGSMGQVSP